MTRKPRRIQLARTKGYRKPKTALVVTRPGRWGNPYRVGQTDPYNTGRVMDAARAVEVYRLALEGGYLPGGIRIEDARRELAGRDLACWCSLPTRGAPDVCHAAVLLEMANR